MAKEVKAAKRRTNNQNSSRRRKLKLFKEKGVFKALDQEIARLSSIVADLAAAPRPVHPVPPPDDDTLPYLLLSRHQDVAAWRELRAMEFGVPPAMPMVPPTFDNVNNSVKAAKLVCHPDKWSTVAPPDGIKEFFQSLVAAEAEFLSLTPGEKRKLWATDIARFQDLEHRRVVHQRKLDAWLADRTRLEALALEIQNLKDRSSPVRADWISKAIADLEADLEASSASLPSSSSNDSYLQMDLSSILVEDEQKDQDFIEVRRLRGDPSYDSLDPEEALSRVPESPFFESYNEAYEFLQQLIQNLDKHVALHHGFIKASFWSVNVAYALLQDLEERVNNGCRTSARILFNIHLNKFDICINNLRNALYEFDDAPVDEI